MKIKILKECAWKAGAIIELAEKQALKLIKAGHAAEASEAEPEKKPRGRPKKEAESDVVDE